MVSILSVIRLPLFGTHFHLKSANLLLLLASKQTSKPTSLQTHSTVPTDPSCRPVRCVSVCMHVCVCARVLAYFFFLLFCYYVVCDVSYFCACFVFVLFIVLMFTLALVHRNEDALASRCTLKVLFIIIIITI